MTPRRPLFYDYNQDLIPRAKDNRHEMTPAERRMWFGILKNLPYRFLRQRVIGNYIVDFYCASRHLVIEVDGDTHFNTEAQAYDQERTNYLEGLGNRVVRFTNSEVVENPDGVFDELQRLLAK
jgi:very-short-patch-repair endonuclease